MSNDPRVGFMSRPIHSVEPFGFDDDPTEVRESPEAASVPSGFQPSWFRCHDGRVYCAIGAAGGYGDTIELAMAEALKRVPAARRWFGA